MFKNYLCSLFEIFKNALKMKYGNWKIVLSLFGLTLVQYFSVSALIVYANLENAPKALSVCSVVGGLVSVFALILMIKLFFDLTSKTLEVDKISYKKMFVSVAYLLFFNLVPPVLINLLMYQIGVQFAKDIVMISFNIASIVLVFIYWLGTNFFFASIVNEKNKPVIISILKSLKLAYQKFHYTLILFTPVFLLQILFGILLMTIVLYILLEFNIANEIMYEMIYIASKVFGFSLVMPLCICLQSAFFKTMNLKKED